MADRALDQTSQVDEAQGDAHAHPPVSQYVLIAAILTVITAVEVACYYIEDQLAGALVWVLLTLSLLKFVIVVGYYMHLKMDNKLLRQIFTVGMIAGVAVSLGLMACFDRLW